MLIYPSSPDHLQTTPVTITQDPRRSRDSLLSQLPTRETVDFLVQYFLEEVNWLYEMIYPLTFLERYNAWWSQESYHGVDDVQFGVWILRLCVNSLQYVISSKDLRERTKFHNYVTQLIALSHTNGSVHLGS
jgi:hypothetical protein